MIDTLVRFKRFKIRKQRSSSIPRIIKMDKHLNNCRKVCAPCGMKINFGRNHKPAEFPITGIYL